MRRRWTLVLLLTMLAGAAWAQIPTKGNVYGEGQNGVRLLTGPAVHFQRFGSQLLRQLY